VHIWGRRRDVIWEEVMIPLNVHSNYSLLQGIITIDELVDKAVEYNLEAIALTDTNSMAGLISFFKKAAEAGIKPILGTHIDEPENKNDYALFLAKNIEGYADICKIITSRKLKTDFSLTGLLQNYLPNLFIIIHSHSLLCRVPAYDNIFAELIISNEKRKRESRQLYKSALARNIKVVASNPVYFSFPEQYLLHKIVTSIKQRKMLSTIDAGDLTDAEFYFKNPSFLYKEWSRIPSAIENIYYIVENCNVDLKTGQYKFPTLPGVAEEGSFSVLWGLTHKGLERRYKKITPEIRARLERELGVINDLLLADYFLIVWDIVREAKGRGMLTIGRGSAANSIVSYCLGFTDVDPIEQNFYFERFLNKSRSSPPDIDVDFSWKDRDEIMKYVFDKYGYDKVAMISTHVTFRARSAFRETAKVFGIAEKEINKQSKFIPWTDAKNLPKLSQLFPEARSLKFDEEPWKSIAEAATQLANFPRHLSIHPSGIIISPKIITEYTALEYAKNKGLGIIVTQPDMYSIEDLGLLKIDLLSQRSLGVLRDTLNIIYKIQRKKSTGKMNIILPNSA
jgi:DNA polymerase III alpha subunit